MGKVVIVGGGISGLTIGFELMERGLSPGELTVLEAGSRPGGNLLTHREDPFLVESGPNGFLDNSPPTLDLVKRLKLDDHLLVSNEASAVRYIYSRGKLRKVPCGPAGMLTSGLLPLGGALRVFMEPFIKKGGHPGETAFDFAARRIGSSAASTLVDAMVSGVFAGNSQNLELVAAFPKMAAMEAEHGGLVKAMMARRKARKSAAREGREIENGAGPAGPGGTLTSFANGFEELPSELAIRLGPCLKTGTRVERLERQDSGGYKVYPPDGKSIFADSVVLACPAAAAAEIIEGLDPDISAELGSIPTSPIAVVATVYDLEEIGGQPPGFGFLVPRDQGPRILGCLWTSSIWKGRAPENTVLLRTMIGGAHDPESMALSDELLLDLAARDLQTTMGLTAAPQRHWIFRHEKGIAQYVPGHTERLKKIDGMLDRHPGIHVAGSSYGGISVNHCIEEAAKIAEKAIRRS